MFTWRAETEREREGVEVPGSGGRGVFPGGANGFRLLSFVHLKGGRSIHVERDRQTFCFFTVPLLEKFLREGGKLMRMDVRGREVFLDRAYVGLIGP